MRAGRCRLLACGVFHREIRWLIQQRRWPVEAVFLDSSLHVDLVRLEKELTAALCGCAGDDLAVFYGACHPRIDRILGGAAAFRTPVENCVEALLGREAYLRELESGAFFLVEDWAKRARAVILGTFGGSEAVAREVFQAECRYLLCIRTPCSLEFSAEAEETGRLLGLPLRWMEASLARLESILGQTIARRLEGTSCPS